MSQIIIGDSLDKLKTLEPNSVDAVVTDPPYGLKFMGKKWDTSVPSVELWREVFRVLKPGGHVLSFGGTRTYHHMAMNIELAGFEIRDQLQWLYGSGFPKSHNLKDDYKGWGTALKPANEPIVLARKPLSESTVSANVLRWGCGAINVDASRISGEPWKAHSATGLAETKFFTDGSAKIIDKEPHSQGRWPANIMFDEDAAQILDKQSGISKSTGGKGLATQKATLSFGGELVGGYEPKLRANAGGLGDSGGASRFFYVAKASKRERGEGNGHPTVKPIKLMQYLIKLITPPNGTVLDPFMGSGSTGVACKELGFKFIGIELNPEYAEISSVRLE